MGVGRVANYAMGGNSGGGSNNKFTGNKNSRSLFSESEDKVNNASLVVENHFKHEPSWNDPPHPTYNVGTRYTVGSTGARTPPSPPIYFSPSPGPSPLSGPTGSSYTKGSLKVCIGEDMPSSAIFIKNLEDNMDIDELKSVFRCFLDERSCEDVKVAGHFDRGFAFCDLGSRDAVARAVNQSRSADGIVDQTGRRLKVEPSKKPVRPSGLRALNERQSGALLGVGGGGGGGASAHKKNHQVRAE